MQFFSEIFNQNFTPKIGNFSFFQLIKIYAGTILLIDKKYISQEASYKAQQSLRRVKSPKACLREKNYLIVNKCDFHYIKPRFFAYKQILNKLRKFLEI